MSEAEQRQIKMLSNFYIGTRYGSITRRLTSFGLTSNSSIHYFSNLTI